MVSMAVNKSTPPARERWFVDLYQRVFPSVARYVHQRGGSLAQAQDIFQDALIIYYERLASGADLPEQEEAYLLGIARHRWARTCRGTGLEVPLDDSTAMGWAEEHEFFPSSRKVLRLLTVAGKKCLDLLRAFYYDQLPLDEVAQTFGYAGVRSATVQKYKCLEKVRTTVKEKSLSYEDFLEEQPTAG